MNKIYLPHKSIGVHLGPRAYFEWSFVRKRVQGEKEEEVTISGIKFVKVFFPQLFFKFFLCYRLN